MSESIKIATDEEWGYANRVANDQFVERCKRKVVDLMPFVYPDVGMLIARIEAQQAEIERLRKLCGEVADRLEEISYDLNTSALKASIDKLNCASKGETQ